MPFRHDLEKTRQVALELGWTQAEVIEALDTWEEPPDKSAWAVAAWNETHQVFLDTARPGELVVWLGYREEERRREKEKVDALLSASREMV